MSPARPLVTGSLKQQLQQPAFNELGTAQLCCDLRPMQAPVTVQVPPLQVATGGPAALGVVLLSQFPVEDIA